MVAEYQKMFGTDPAVVALVGGAEKPTAIVATNEAARGLGIGAGRLISGACAALGGKGGGKDDMAQGGGTDASAAAVRTALEERA